MKVSRKWAIKRYFESGMYIRSREPLPAVTGEPPKDPQAAHAPLARHLARGVVAGQAETENPVLLFVHGLGESGLCFENLLVHPGLAGYHLLVPDLPGYGRSPWRTHPWTLEQQADHLAAWWRSSPRSPAKKAIILGHSMGGVLGLLYCERHPDCASALIDVDGNKSPKDCVFSSRAASRSLDDFLEGGFAELEEHVFEKGKSDTAHRGYYVSLRLCDPRCYHLNSTELIELSQQEDLATRLAALPLPAHYIAGVPDGVSSHSQELLEKAAVNWRKVEPSGHWPFIDQPDTFTACLKQILGPIRRT